MHNIGNLSDETKHFYRAVFALVLPMALQNLINVAVQSADVIMLGRLPHSEIVLSASSLAGQVYFIMSLILFGLCSGVSVLLAQYWGKKDLNSIKVIWGIALRLSLIISFLFSLFAFFFAQPIMDFLTSESAVAAEGVKYLRIVCISYIFMAFTMLYLNVMRCMERVIISTIIYLISLILNVILNYIFIFGHFGISAMGIRGAAIATVCARISEVGMVLIYNKFFNDTVPFQIQLFTMDHPLLRKDFLHFSMPVILNELLWGLGMSANAAILGNLGSDVSSASAIVQVTRQLSMVVCMGIAGATAIMIGKTIGEKNMDLARRHGKRFFVLSIYSGILSLLIVAAVRPILLHTMNLNASAQDYLGYMLLLMMGYVIFQSINTVGIVGIFRAGGDTRFGLIVDMFGLWCVSIIPSFLCAFVFHLDTKIVYLIMVLDEPAKVFLTIWRFKSYRWLKNVTRDY